MWKDCERLQSSTWGELYAIEFSLRSFAPVLEGSHVKWFTDNQAAAKIVEVGSMKFELHKMARRIFEICISSGIYLEVQWIPRDQNQQADYVSRLLDTDDWQTTTFCFSHWMPVGDHFQLIVLPITTTTSCLDSSLGFGTLTRQV